MQEVGKKAVYDRLELLLTKMCKWARKRICTIGERIRDYKRLAIRERELRRQFRAPMGKGPYDTWGGPDLGKAATSVCHLKVAENLPIWGAENMGKKLTHAKRRTLRIVPGARQTGG